MLLANGMNNKDSGAENVAVTTILATGVIAGPAVGLWSGGRGDLAKRGFIIRAVGTAICAGSFAGASTLWDGGQNDGAAVLLGIMGVVSGIGTTLSLFHDLAITPSATAQGQRMSAELGIRSDGKVALSVRF